MRTSLGIALALFAVAIRAAPPPATIAMAVGQSTATALSGVMRVLAKGDSVAAGEVLATGPNSYLNVRLSDGGYVLLRPASRFVIDAYSYSPITTSSGEAAPAATEQNHAFMRLLRGGFRAVTGAIGKNDPDSYRVLTPTATLGIRGTDYVAVLCDAACALDPVIADTLPSGATAEGALVAGVVEGGIVLSDPASGAMVQILKDSYVLGLPGGRFTPLAAEPRFMRVDPIPNPRTCD